MHDIKELRETGCHHQKYTKDTFSACITSFLACITSFSNFSGSILATLSATIG